MLCTFRLKPMAKIIKLVSFEKMEVKRNHYGVGRGKHITKKCCFNPYCFLNSN